MINPNILKRVQKIGHFEKTYDVLGLKATLQTLKGKANLNVVASATQPNNETLKNKQYQYTILSESLTKLGVQSEQDPEEWEESTFKDVKECEVFLKKCENIFIEELIACYEDLLDTQKASLEKDFGNLKQVELQKKYFERQMASLIESIDKETEDEAKEDLEAVTKVSSENDE